MAQDKSNIAGFEHFRRYQRGEMSLGEQHLFEKQMLEDPMLADAYEGFLALQHNDADFASIKNDLDKKLGDRISIGRKRTIPLWTYGAAASLLITLGTLWLVFLSNPKKGDMKETGQNPVEEPLIQPETEPKFAPQAKPEATITSRTAQREQPVEKRSDKSEVSADVLVNREEKGAEVTVAAPDVAAPDVAATVGAASSGAAPSGAASEPVPAQQEKQALSYSEPPASKGGSARQLSEEARFNKSENVVSQTTVTRQQATLAAVTDLLSRFIPRPLMGWEGYNAYLNKQVGKTRRGGEVTVQFQVNANGTLSHFTAQGEKTLQKEAIRIVREGPLWVPAKQSASAARMPASIRLRFKK